MFLFFPIGVYAGQIVAWKWELIGGFITLLSIIAFHLLGEDFFLFQL